MEDEKAARRRGVDRLGQDCRPAPLFSQFAVYGLDQVRERTREAVELPDDQDIARSHEGEGLRQAGAIVLALKCLDSSKIRYISDQYGPFHGKVLSATMSEAPHVLDGLLHHGTTLTIKEHYLYTGGASDHVFALCDLLGFRFVPRLRDFQDYRLGVIEKPAAYKGIDSLFGRPIRIDVIREDWDDIIRLAASIKAGTAAPSPTLTKLAAFRDRTGSTSRFPSLAGSSARYSCSIGWKAQNCGSVVMPG